MPINTSTAAATSDLVNFKFKAFSFTMRYVQFQQTYVDRDCTLLAWEPLDNLQHLAEHAHGGSAMDSVPARSAAEAAELAEDGSNAEPVKHAEQTISLCGLCDFCVE
jgi:hypothetical protein